MYVDGLTECVVESLDDCLKYMDVGAKNRQVRQTAKNHQSSRSHSIFTLYIQSTEKKFGVFSSKASRLHLVDLAGSERQKETQTSGASLKEASNINKVRLSVFLSCTHSYLIPLVGVAHTGYSHPRSCRSTTRRDAAYSLPRLEADIPFEGTDSHYFLLVSFPFSRRTRLVETARLQLLPPSRQLPIV